MLLSKEFLLKMQKIAQGLGEGGAIPPPATIANAVNDALRESGVEVAETPITPRRVLTAIWKAKQSRLSSVETS